MASSHNPSSETPRGSPPRYCRKAELQSDLTANRGAPEPPPVEPPCDHPIPPRAGRISSGTRRGVTSPDHPSGSGDQRGVSDYVLNRLESGSVIILNMAWDQPDKAIHRVGQHSSGKSGSRNV